MRISLLLIIILILLFVALKYGGGDDSNTHTPLNRKTMINPDLIPMSKTIIKAIDLKNTQWILSSINRANLDPNVYISFYLDSNNRIIGFTGCNSFGGQYIANDSGAISINEITQTLIGCHKNVQDIEKLFTHTLSKISKYKVEGNKLTLSNKANNTPIVFSLQPEYAMSPNDLKNTDWRLISINGVSLVEDLNITLSFNSANQMTGLSGCIEYELYCKLEKDNMLCGNRSTRLCNNLEKNIDQQSLLYSDTLGHWINYQLSKNHLVINTLRGEGLVFVPN